MPSYISNCMPKFALWVKKPSKVTKRKTPRLTRAIQKVRALFCRRHANVASLKVSDEPPAFGFAYSSLAEKVATETELMVHYPTKQRTKGIFNKLFHLMVHPLAKKNKSPSTGAISAVNRQPNSFSFATSTISQSTFPPITYSNDKKGVDIDKDKMLAVYSGFDGTPMSNRSFISIPGYIDDLGFGLDDSSCHTSSTAATMVSYSTRAIMKYVKKKKARQNRGHYPSYISV